MAVLSLKTPPRLKLALGEELFPELAPVQGHITCRACEAKEEVPLGHPALLCFACLSDLPATAGRVSSEYADAMVAFFQAGEALEKASQGNEWYAKTEAARAEVSPTLFQRAWEAARGGEPAVLIGMREWLDETAELMRRAELRYIAAAPELSAARIAFGEPVEV